PTATGGPRSRHRYHRRAAARILRDYPRLGTGTPVPRRRWGRNTRWRGARAHPPPSGHLGRDGAPARRWSDGRTRPPAKETDQARSRARRPARWRRPNPSRTRPTRPASPPTPARSSSALRIDERATRGSPPRSARPPATPTALQGESPLPDLAA